jgi:hypothetical protein
MEDGDTWSQHHNNKGWLMRRPGLKGWGDALLSFINPLASFRLERTGRNCSTLFYCPAFNAANFFISICLSSNLYLLCVILHLAAVAVRHVDLASNRRRFVSEDRIANTFANKRHTYGQLWKLNTRVRAKSGRKTDRNRYPPALAVNIFSRNPDAISKF